VLVVTINCCGFIAPIARSNGQLMLGYHMVPNLPHKGRGVRVNSVAPILRVPQSQKCFTYRATRAGSEGRGERLLKEYLEPASKVALLREHLKVDSRVGLFKAGIS